ncbi:NAD-dependent epimerase/dehydratase family protein [Cryobacterium lyxosi]|uniref:GDP-L-fucose synthase n=1 Tax=Cryobacterium lyxosi TaxID=1259228 RepID=A0A4R8ZLF8_9MICO|nr:NAD-dependent epimerase/dehydratase family protein [Cryobacterium lyxosi]TFD29186.1 NAD-dependent epimerase/dehydratase family protein [Cryobacterium lyxosi]
MRVLLTGGAGMLGSSIAAEWRVQRPLDELIVATRQDADLRDRTQTREFFAASRPDAIIHAAAKVGSIQAKIAEPTTYLLDNLLLDSSVLSAAIELKIPELVYVSSAAIYPAEVRQPIVESDLLGGPLEAANEGYSLAKIAAGKVCEYASRQFGFRYRVVAPSNLYGPNDDYSLGHGHLVAAAIAKIHAATVAGNPTVEVWGDGTARREFTYVVDLAKWLVTQVGSLEDWPEVLNLGCGTDHSIAEYYEVAKKVVGYTGSFVFAPSKPSGVPQRLLDSTHARALGWNPTTSLEIGMAASYAKFLTSPLAERQ